MRACTSKGISSCGIPVEVQPKQVKVVHVAEPAIDLDGMLGSPHRRQFVRPLPIVALVVWIELLACVARILEQSFDLIESLARDHEIDVGRHSAARHGKPGNKICRAFEQYDRAVVATERTFYAVQFPPYHLATICGFGPSRIEVGPGLDRY